LSLVCGFGIAYIGIFKIKELLTDK